MKKLMVVAVAAAFGLSLAGQASAAGDSLILAQASGASSTGTGSTGGVPSTQSSGEPRAPTDNKADTRRCESMTGVERETCMRDASAPRGATSGSTGSAIGTTGSATGGATSAPSGAAVTPGGTGKTGTTAGPGEASNRTAPSSDTATSPSTSGQGKAQ